MSIRHCVVCDPEGPVVERLREAHLPGWIFHHAATLQAIRPLVRDHGCQVGVMSLDAHALPSMSAIEAAIADSPAEWIAVIDRAAVATRDMDRLLDDCFHDFHTEPLDLSRLGSTIGHAWGKAMLKQRRRQGASADEHFGMVGESEAMRALCRTLAKVVAAQASVLVTGESGTGKELVARAIHRHSPRARGPFIAMNCGALPANLIQSELFGHERGAFTGAHRTSVGSIEAAHGGVLFLDEVVDLPLEQQGNLLRVLQERSLVRLGSTRRIDVDVRVIAAANVDLERAVAEGRFRSDLYYRLNVLRLRLPPLRERGADVRALAQHAFATCGEHRPPRLRGFALDAFRAMERHDWPGNVRELFNRVQQAMVMGEGRLITARDLGLDSVAGEPGMARLDDARASLDRSLLVETLRRNEGNVSRTAREMGVSRVTVYRMMDRHGLHP